MIQFDFSNGSFDILTHDQFHTGYLIFRVAYGLLLLLFMVGYIKIQEPMCGKEAFFPQTLFEKHRLRPFGLFDFFDPSTAFATSIAFGMLAASLLMFTQMPGCYLFPLLWISLCSLQGRNAFFNYGGDDVFRLLGFVFLFDFHNEPPVSMLPAKVLVISVYWNTAIHKFLSKEWRDGSALFGFTQLTMIARFAPPKFMTNPFAFRTATYLALTAEFAIPILLAFRETAILGVAAGLGLHLGIQLTSRLHLFQLIMICGLLLFVDDQTFATVFGRGIIDGPE